MKINKAAKKPKVSPKRNLWGNRIMIVIKMTQANVQITLWQISGEYSVWLPGNASFWYGEKNQRIKN